MESSNIVFGLPNEWPQFEKRNPEFINRLRPLFDTLNETFIREVPISCPADSVVFFLGRLCTEDFMEILLLCGNGYGIGGLKLLRGLYERAVTMAYIAKNPQKATAFLEYHHVHVGKQFNHAARFLQMEQYFSPETIKQIKDSYDKAKLNYQEVTCVKCGTSRTRFSWSDLDLLSMARESGLDGLYRECYYEPTLQAHSTASSLFARLHVQDNGQVVFNGSAQHDWADLAIMAAHQVILSIIETANNYMKLNMDKQIQDRIQDFKLIWSNKSFPSS